MPFAAAAARARQARAAGRPALLAGERVHVCEDARRGGGGGDGTGAVLRRVAAVLGAKVRLLALILSLCLS